MLVWSNIQLALFAIIVMLKLVWKAVLYDAMIEPSIYFTAINDILAAYKIFSTRLWLIMGLSAQTRMLCIYSFTEHEHSANDFSDEAKIIGIFTLW